ncbi:MAG: molecular chaperone GrpE [Deferribacteres bacterium]|jgi:molecular chaperone GrpE|nr:grpE [Deferribacteraceae bacterium]MDK2792720.1 molecular chaperone GrpE [Deferribacteres bacterium]
MSKRKKDEEIMSEENKNNENIQESEEAKVEESEDTEKLMLKMENESLKKEVQESKDQMLRLAAELDNFRKRLSKETEDKLKYANQQIILDFLTIIDNLEMALAHIKESEEIKALKQGVELTLKQFKDTLAKYGAKEIQTNIGDEFNPNLHDAMMLDSDQNHKNNAITLVMQKGYTLHDRVIRPTKVRVNKVENIEEKED